MAAAAPTVRSLAAASCLVALTVALAPCVAVAADPPAPVVPSLEGLSADLLVVQKSLQNARIKFERGIVSGFGGEGSERESRPMFRCCGSNLETIDKTLRRVLVHIDGLARRADAAGDEIALGQLELIHDGVMGLGQGLQALAGAQTERRAEAALAGMIRPFTMATTALRGLATCCRERLEPGAPPPSSAVEAPAQ